RVSPLLVARRAVLAQAELRERDQLVGERERAGELAARLGEAVGETHAQRPVAAHAAAGEDQIERVGVPDEAGQAHIPAVDQWYAPAPAEHAEHRVAR